MPHKIQYVLVFLFLNFLFFSCNHEKFDKTRWAQYDEVDGPDRDLMAEDLVKTHKLIGLSHKKMLQLLGSPANYTDTTKTYYVLREEGEWLSPDPVSGKDLIIKFNKDSVIISAEIKEWHKH